MPIKKIYTRVTINKAAMVETSAKINSYWLKQANSIKGGHKVETDRVAVPRHLQK